MDELKRQIEMGECPSPDVIAMACGSGGTSAGVALGNHLAGIGASVVAYGVCDSPEEFHGWINDIFDGLGATSLRSENLVTIRQAKGAGYAISKPEELETICDVSRRTGVVTDPVYSGKALTHFVSDLESGEFDGKTVLFLHTGGGFALYDKLSDLQSHMDSHKRVQRMPLP